MKNKQVLPMVQAALIAAMYVVLTWLANIFGLANGAIQVRFSEALTILPYFTPAAIPGLFVGCDRVGGGFCRRPLTPPCIPFGTRRFS